MLLHTFDLLLVSSLLANCQYV